jgi:hypothetical protein
MIRLLAILLLAGCAAEPERRPRKYCVERIDVPSMFDGGYGSCDRWCLKRGGCLCKASCVCKSEGCN